MEEIWKPVLGFEGLYEISNKCCVRRLDTFVLNRHKTKSFLKGHIMHLHTDKEGYLYFFPCKNGKSKNYRIHNCLYEAFVKPIPKGYEVHHINHNKKDNRLENLCLIELHKHRKMHYEENSENLKQQMKDAKQKAVLQYTKNGQFVAEYESTMEAQRKTGINNAHIGKCCNNKPKYKSAGGFIWKWKEVA